MLSHLASRNGGITVCCILRGCHMWVACGGWCVWGSWVCVAGHAARGFWKRCAMGGWHCRVLACGWVVCGRVSWAGRAASRHKAASDVQRGLARSGCLRVGRVHGRAGQYVQQAGSSSCVMCSAWGPALTCLGCLRVAGMPGVAGQVVEQAGSWQLRVVLMLCGVCGLALIRVA